VSGTPTATGTSSFTVEVSDSSTPTSSTSATVSLAVGANVVVTGVGPDSGPTTGGTTVSVSGSGFTGATSVTFGGVGGSGLSVQSNTSLTVTSPPGAAGTVDVVVSTPGASSATNPSDEFTYSAPQSATVVTCDNDSTCNDDEGSSLDDTNISATGTSDSTGTASMSLVVNTGTLGCPGGYSYMAAIGTLSTTGFSPDATVTVSETIGNEPSIKGVEVCYAPGTGTTGGTFSKPAQATEGTFLKPCKANKPHVPCLVSLVSNFKGGVVATFDVPSGDPRFWAGGAPVDLSSFSPTSGKAGATVTLKGKNLTSVVSVVMGGTKATIVSVTSSKVVVTVPAGAVTGPISVTSPSGTAISVVSFSVT
jgi:hypothetical protein